MVDILHIVLCTDNNCDECIDRIFCILYDGAV